MSSPRSCSPGRFPQSRELFLAGFAAWLGLCVYGAGLLDDNRAYGVVLCGYTVALVAVSQIDTPQNIFSVGVNRGAAIVVGISSLALFSNLFTTPNVHTSLSGKLAAAQQRVRDFARAILRQQRPGHDGRLRVAGRSGERATDCIYVVDDDRSMRASLSSLFRSVDLRVELFGSAAEFLSHKRSDGLACLVLDIRLPGVSGLDFQAQLQQAGIHIPIVFVIGHGDIPMSVRAMNAGAVDFLAKPFRNQDMLDAVAAALRRDEQMRATERSSEALRESFERLSVREREVMELVTSGLMNKKVASKRGPSEITVKVHRSHAMKKMRATSLAELVRMSESLGLHPSKERQP